MSIDLSRLNPAQQAAVTHHTGPAMVLAGAGSGKTTVLTTRVAWLIEEKGVSPDSILVVTFTNKAAQEMKKRIYSLTNANLPFAGTFHSLGAKILRRDGYLIGLEPNFVIYDSDDQLQLYKEIYKKHNFDPKEYIPKAVAGTISKAKNEVISVKEYTEFAKGKYQEFVARVYKLYQRALQDAQAVDFDDLLIKVLQLLTLNDEIRNYYQNKFQFVLIDEYQDTNRAQFLITKAFAHPQNNLYVVGDFSQSIYGWRGADYRNMLQLKTEFIDIKEYRLEQNYRSHQSILDAATDIIKHNTSHPILELWTDQTEIEPIICHQTQDNTVEALQVGEYIREMRRRGCDYTDIAILYRTNAQSRSFEEAFIKMGIPYELIGGTKFYERKEVKDVIAYLRYVLNPADIVSLERITKLGQRRLSNLQIWIGRQNREELMQKEPAETLKEILDESNYLSKYKLETEENIDRIENVRELVNVAAQFRNPHQFLENVALIQDNQFMDMNKEGNNNRVSLMSLHSAKGLEFEVVFMVGMEEGMLPHSRSFMDPGEMEEERRLCYVGITRAKKHLYFTYTRSRFIYGNRQPSIRSRFIGDISTRLLQMRGQVEESYQPQNNNPFRRNFDGNSSKKPASLTGRRVIPLDDDILDGVLNGEVDIRKLIDL